MFAPPAFVTFLLPLPGLKTAAGMRLREAEKQDLKAKSQDRAGNDKDASQAPLPALKPQGALGIRLLWWLQATMALSAPVALQIT